MPNRSSIVATFAFRSDPAQALVEERGLQVLVHRQVVDEVVGLEDESRSVLAVQLRPPLLAHLVDGLAEEGVGPPPTAHPRGR